MTLHGVSLKSNSHLFYIHGVMFQASGKFHTFSIEFACISLCHIVHQEIKAQLSFNESNWIPYSVEVLVKRFDD